MLHTTTPHWYWHHEEGEDERAFSPRCAEELDRLIQAEGPETVAAFIGEPVLGTGRHHPAAGRLLGGNPRRFSRSTTFF